ncbi:alanine racemase [Subtercola boreus]|uniref:D-serine dehydratase-like domain-containing protein n=1 Tax=Subtercola boreus TaxID=120213 RepID=A0A3E0W9D4_9MICO|nr:alanine racemase [Subtercola boreus]RFA19321.1 hypothetical protein B7R24_11765 [Subtercola boreus]RFA19582.1 hypothetical protein B7R23_11745 [Subtercola boreus]RFA25947.1 hypothetical protein B7R25_11865 [Subtercola boreus]
MDKGETASGEVPLGRHVLDASLLPILSIAESALEHNIRTMAEFSRRHGLLLAPHMKTHMAPALAARQLDAGAWGVTVASVQQAIVAWEAGIRRLVIANEVLDPAGLAWIAERSLGSRQADTDVLVYVDSAAGVAAMARALEARPGGTIHTLVELGWAGGRTGVRSRGDALDLAAALHAVPGLTLRGTAGYEGGFTSVAAVRSYLADALDTHNDLLDQGLLPAESIVSMGGSAFFDVVAEELGRRRPGTTALLRSGAYLTHDDGVYAGKTPFGRIPGEGRLVAALDVWARVVSTPEPGLAVVAMGKRDAPFDEGLPRAKGFVSGGSEHPVTGADLDLFRMDDQHGYLRVADAFVITPGDVVRFGISHPCTAFDRWRLVLLVDDGAIVRGAVRTHF